MSGLLEVLGAVVVIVFAGMVLWGLYWILINLLDDFVNRRLNKLYEQQYRLWSGVEDAYDNYEDLKEKVWDYESVKSDLKAAMKDIEDLEEYVLNQDSSEKKIDDLWAQRDSLPYLMGKPEDSLKSPEDFELFLK